MRCKDPSMNSAEEPVEGEQNFPDSVDFLWRRVEKRDFNISVSFSLIGVNF